MSQYHRQKSIQEEVVGEAEGGETKKAAGESGRRVRSHKYFSVIFALSFALILALYLAIC